MSITKDEKKELIAEYGRTDEDTGSTEVQVSMLTTRIRSLTGHLQVHKKDHASRRGLLMLVGRRSRLLKYMARQDRPAYLALSTKLDIRIKH